MLNSIASKITKKLFLHKIVDEDMFDIYVYGFELLLSFLFSTAIVLSVGALLGRIVPTLIFLLIFILLRSYTGGYHANTYTACTVVTLVVFGCVLLLSELVVVSMELYIVLSVVGIVVLLLFAPIEHPNKVITAQKKKKYKIISIGIFSMFVIGGAFLCYAKIQLNAVVFFTLAADLLLLFIKSRKKGEKNHEIFGNHLG